MLFSFAQHAKWDDERRAVLVSYGVNRDRGEVVIGATTFRAAFGRPINAAACVMAYHLHRIEFERTAELLYRSGIVEPNGDIVIEPADLPDF